MDEWHETHSSTPLRRDAKGDEWRGTFSSPHIPAPLRKDATERLSDWVSSEKFIRRFKRLAPLPIVVVLAAVAFLYAKDLFNSSSVTFIKPSKTLGSNAFDKNLHSCVQRDETSDVYKAWNATGTTCNGTTCMRLDDLDIFMEIALIYFREETNFVCTSMANLPFEVPCQCLLSLSNGSTILFSSYNIVSKSRSTEKFAYTLPFFYGTEKRFYDVVPRSILISIIEYLDSDENLLTLEGSDVNSFLRAASALYSKPQ